MNISLMFPLPLHLMPLTPLEQNGSESHTRGARVPVISLQNLVLYKGCSVNSSTRVTCSKER